MKDLGACSRLGRSWLGRILRDVVPGLVVLGLVVPGSVVPGSVGVPILHILKNSFVKLVLILRRLKSSIAHLCAYIIANVLMWNMDF
jgi:hypothetical protein